MTYQYITCLPVLENQRKTHLLHCQQFIKRTCLWKSTQHDTLRTRQLRIVSCQAYVILWPRCS